MEGTTTGSSESPEAFSELERAVRSALETYSNVHRGSGHNSMITTALYEGARDVVMDYLGLNHGRHTVIFGTLRSASRLRARLDPAGYRVLSSRELGLPLGVRAITVERKALPKGAPDQSGGGTVKIVSPGSAIWADAPDRFEAGTPGIVNVIAFAKALQLTRIFGPDAFQARGERDGTADRILHDDEQTHRSGLELLGELRAAVIGRDILVPTANGMRRYVNLDNAASTPAFLPVWDAARRTLRLPASARGPMIEKAREICADFLGAPLKQFTIVFTGNATEAINLVAQGFCGRESVVVLNTLAEHNSNELPWRFIPGISLLRLPVDNDGFAELGLLEGLLEEHNGKRARGRTRISLVSVSGASNVLGACNDIPALSRLAHRFGARILVDAAQLVAHRRISMEELGIDFLAFSAHKMYAPFGSGVLAARKGLLHFDARESALIEASGEENAAGIAALGKAMILLRRVGMDVIEAEERKLTALALERLARIRGLKVYGVQGPASSGFRSKAGIIAFGFDRVPHNLAAKELAERGGIGVRTGCFCAHLLVKRLLKIHPLRAKAADIGMTLFPRLSSSLLPGFVRVSFGIENDETDVDHCIGTLSEIALAPRMAADRLLARMHSGTPRLPRTAPQASMEMLAQGALGRIYSPTARTRRQRQRRKFRCCA